MNEEKIQARIAELQQLIIADVSCFVSSFRYDLEWDTDGSCDNDACEKFEAELRVCEANAFELDKLLKKISK